MKTTPFLLAASLTIHVTLGQTLEQSFNKLIADFKTNPYAYVQANYAPDLRFIAGHNGEFRTKERMISPNTKVEDIQATDLKFFESGDLAVVSGINTTRYAQPNGQSATYKDAFTYTFRRLDGGWKHLAMQHTKLNYDVPGQSKADEEAIKKVIEASTAAAYSKDIPTYKSMWVSASYISRVNAGTEGKVSRQTGDGFAKAYDDWEKNGKPVDVHVTRDNWLIRVNGSSAFVLFDQHNQNADDTKRDSVEERYLEKVGNAWKLVNITVLPKK